MKKGLRLPDEIYEFIKGEVIFLFVQLGIKSIPINGFEIAYKMGIVLVPYSSLSKRKYRKVKKEKEGFFIEGNGVEYIYYNDIDRSYERINMTILHEIGHCVLDHRGVNSEIEEAEANFFAKYAIAPPVLVEKINPAGPEDIYEAFDISFDAAWYAWNYYKLWKKFHYAYGGYTDYEQALIKMQESA
ncbi:ImmA/IrrE family metallo-endopeptidase [Butyrivibrio sp. MB2005]|uniref:ImmA/IrrE family metallo-endopeptidase n=1 Tax=Butyrivibrio sp. MB2005 TaxID=1280678 RepID=UPI0004016CAE|nr:ImmA/IrrE family metallo-endopeptidase [Butyrivibrio sp. MB2005]